MIRAVPVDRRNDPRSPVRRRKTDDYCKGSGRIVGRDQRECFVCGKVVGKVGKWTMSYAAHKPIHPLARVEEVKADGTPTWAVHVRAADDGERLVGWIRQVERRTFAPALFDDRWEIGPGRSKTLAGAVADLLDAHDVVSSFEVP